MKNNIVVIIVAYNAEKYINNCLDSLLIQRWEKFRVLIIDNSSTDTTLELIKKHQINKRIIVLRNDENLGFAKACNIGVTNANSYYIFTTNQDVIFPADFFQKLIECYREYKIFWRVIWFD